MAGGDELEQVVRAELTQYYADMKCKNGQMVPEYESHFWPGATLATVWQPPGTPRPAVVVTTVAEFMKQAPNGPCSKPIFEEAMDASEAKVHNGLAQVWAHYQACFGEPGKLNHWQGIDAFSLLQHEGKWRIASLVYRAD